VPAALAEQLAPAAASLPDGVSQTAAAGIAEPVGRLADTVGNDIGVSIARVAIDLSAALDKAIADIDAGLAGTIESIDGALAEVTDGLSTSDIGTQVTAGVAELETTLGRTLSQVSDTVGDLAQSLPALAAAAIPATLLGASGEEKQPDGLLAKLFDSADAAVSPPIILPHAPTDSAPAAQDRAEAGHDAPSGGLVDVAFADLSAGAIEAVRIGFAGQSYAEAGDAHDGPAGSHANLLHGLL
jgi:hypothetical protein